MCVYMCERAYVSACLLLYLKISQVNWSCTLSLVEVPVREEAALSRGQPGKRVSQLRSLAAWRKMVSVGVHVCVCGCVGVGVGGCGWVWV